MKKSFGEAFGLSFSYTNQSQMLMSIPMFRTTIHEKCFLTFKFFQNFFMASIYMSIFTTLLVSPQIKLVTDYEISLVKGYYPDPITNFGIGEPCLNELKQGDFPQAGFFFSLFYSINFSYHINGFWIRLNVIRFWNLQVYINDEDAFWTVMWRSKYYYSENQFSIRFIQNAENLSNGMRSIHWSFLWVNCRVSNLNYMQTKKEWRKECRVHYYISKSKLILEALTRSFTHSNRRDEASEMALSEKISGPIQMRRILCIRNVYIILVKLCRSTKVLSFYEKKSIFSRCLKCQRNQSISIK